MAADKWLEDRGIPPSDVGHVRGDARNHFTYRKKVYKPNSELVFEGKRLKILGRLGEGAFGTAWLVMDWETRELFTLKHFKNLGDNEKKDIRRAMHTLQGEPHLPDGTIQKFISRDVEEEGLVLYSYVGGKDLSHQFKEKEGMEAEVKQGIVYTLRLIETWDILAKLGIAHRDISLRNSMPTGTLIDPDGVGRIEELQGQPLLNQVWFSAPEACNGVVHPTSDLFSIGVIGATFILGGVPQSEQVKNRPLRMRGWDDYEDSRGSLAELVRRRSHKGFKKEPYWEIVHQSPSWEGLRNNPQVRGFVNMLGKMLEYDPEERPSSAQACLDLFRE